MAKKNNNEASAEIKENSDTKMEILISAIYTFAAVTQLISLISRAYGVKNGSKIDLGHYQLLNNDIQRYSQIVYRNFHLLIGQAKTFFQGTREFYRELVRCVQEKGLSFIILLEYSVMLPGDPEIQSFSFSLMNPRQLSNGEKRKVFISHREQKIYRPLNETAEMLIAEIIEAVRKKSRN